MLAAGGIGTGRQIAAALALGCRRRVDGIDLAHDGRERHRPDGDGEAARRGRRATRCGRAAWTGKPARQLRTEWTEAWEREDSPGYLPMPLQYMATNDAHAPHRQVQVKELTGMPVGQIVGRMNKVRPVRDVMFDLVEEFVESSRELEKLVEE